MWQSKWREDRLIVAKPPIHSPKALRASLRALEAAEIVVRHDMSGIVLHVEYDFAENMRPTKSRRNNKSGHHYY